MCQAHCKMLIDETGLKPLSHFKYAVLKWIVCYFAIYIVFGDTNIFDNLIFLYLYRIWSLINTPKTGGVS